MCVSKLCVDKLCVDKLLVSKLCVDKLCVDTLCVCVSKLCVGGGRERERAGASAQPKTRTPHKDVGKKIEKNSPSMRRGEALDFREGRQEHR